MCSQDSFHLQACTFEQHKGAQRSNKQFIGACKNLPCTFGYGLKFQTHVTSTPIQ